MKEREAGMWSVERLRDTERERGRERERERDMNTHTHTHTLRERAFEGWIDCFEVRIEETMAFSCEGGSPRGLPQNQRV